MIKSGYLENLLVPDKFNRTIEAAVKTLSPHTKKIDAIVCCGMSGALVAPTIAAQLNKNLIFIRKDKQHHSPYMVEGDTTANRLIIIDDMICTGNTIRYIVSRINYQWEDREIGNTNWDQYIKTLSPDFSKKLVAIYLYVDYLNIYHKQLNPIAFNCSALMKELFNNCFTYQGLYSNEEFFKVKTI